MPGRQREHDYRVQTFIVPATDDPGSFEYGLIRPKGGGRNALYRIGSAYANEMTGQNSGPGEPGEIVTLPPLTFAAFPPEWIPPGRYRFGVACTLRAQTTRYWDGELVMSEAPEVQPGQRRWTVIPPSDPLDASSSSGSTWILVAVESVPSVPRSISFAGEPSLTNANKGADMIRSTLRVRILRFIVWTGVVISATMLVVTIAAAIDLPREAVQALPPGTAPAGAVTMTPSSGDRTTQYVLGVPLGAACPGDNTAGFTWGTFITPIATDPASLIYSATGTPQPASVGNRTFVLHRPGLHSGPRHRVSATR